MAVFAALALDEIQINLSIHIELKQIEQLESQSWQLVESANAAVNLAKHDLVHVVLVQHIYFLQGSTGDQPRKVDISLQLSKEVRIVNAANLLFDLGTRFLFSLDCCILLLLLSQGW